MIMMSYLFLSKEYKVSYVNIQPTKRQKINVKTKEENVWTG